MIIEGGGTKARLFTVLFVFFKVFMSSLRSVNMLLVKRNLYFQEGINVIFIMVKRFSRFRRSLDYSQSVLFLRVFMNSLRSVMELGSMTRRSADGTCRIQWQVPTILTLHITTR